jgi:acyl phosphate:glycerol-3-phosphate acyltransferase
MIIGFSALIIAYLLGSIPFGYIVVKHAHGTDIRALGSGNIGATNVYRKSRGAGIATLILDAAKGYIAVLAAAWLTHDTGWQAMAAVAAILGHMFTVFLSFKGGKGVATACGAYLAFSPQAVALTVLVFIAVAALTRYVSLASIAAAASFPLAVYLRGEPNEVLAAAIIGGALIVAKHHQNIHRLLTGTENKFALGSRS